MPDVPKRNQQPSQGTAHVTSCTLRANCTRANAISAQSNANTSRACRHSPPSSTNCTCSNTELLSPPVRMHLPSFTFASHQPRVQVLEFVSVSFETSLLFHFVDAENSFKRSVLVHAQPAGANYKRTARARCPSTKLFAAQRATESAPHEQASLGLDCVLLRSDRR